jgi:hypothetical protein
MPEDAKTEALKLQRQYFGKPEELAIELARICLTKTDVVNETFLLLDNYSQLDVGCRFLKHANFYQLVKTKNGLFLCRQLHRWLTEFRLPLIQPPACTGNIATLMLLKSAADTAPPPTDEKEPSPYYTIDDGIVLSTEAIGMLDKIGVEYFKRIGKKFNVNSGTRTPYRQAAAMYVKYAKDKALSEYGGGAAIKEILAAIKTAQSVGKNSQGVVQAMADTIQSQVDRGIYISSHLKAGALDIAIVASPGVSAMTKAEKKAMIEIAAKVTGGKAFEETNPPHIHIQYK